MWRLVFGIRCQAVIICRNRDFAAAILSTGDTSEKNWIHHRRLESLGAVNLKRYILC